MQLLEPSLALDVDADVMHTAERGAIGVLPASSAGPDVMRLGGLITDTAGEPAAQLGLRAELLVA